MNDVSGRFPAKLHGQLILFGVDVGIIIIWEAEKDFSGRGPKKCWTDTYIFSVYLEHTLRSLKFFRLIYENKKNSC